MVNSSDLSSQRNGQPDERWSLVLGEMTALRRLVEQQQQHDGVSAELQQQIASQQQDLQDLGSYLQQLGVTLGRYQPPDYAPLLGELQETIATIQEKQEELETTIAKHSPSKYLPAIEEKMASFEARLEALERAVQEQEMTVRSQFNVKVLGANVLMMSLVTSLAVIVGLWLFPPHPGVEAKLNMLNQRIEQVRKQTKQ
jgi:DNA repair exonuclease SbcCD ATPase subunit